MNQLADKLQESEAYWTEHTVTSNKEFTAAEESLDYFHWRNAQYMNYINLLPVANHDGEVIVDYGCGPGNDLVGFHVYSAPRKLYGMDISLSALAQADARLALHGGSAEFMQLVDGQSTLPLEDQSVDYVHCSGVLMLVPDEERTLGEFYRILKPGGYARVMVYERNSLWFHLYAAHILRTTDDRYRDLDLDEAFKRSTDGFDCPINRSYRIDEFLDLGNGAGFETRHLGNAISVFEMSLLSQRFAAIMDIRLPAECRDFLSALVFDARGVPSVNHRVAGIDACYELRKPK